MKPETGIFIRRLRVPVGFAISSRVAAKKFFPYCREQLKSLGRKLNGETVNTVSCIDHLLYL